ncbi:MAG: trypsin-like peptidase domain-containing protein [bacterium]
MKKLGFSFIVVFSLLVFFNGLAKSDDLSDEFEQKLQIEQGSSLEKNKNAVVKIYSNINIHNWIEPYKMPENAKIAGSGFFISGDGYILTNHHVIEGATKVYINIPSQGKKQFNCEVVGAYPERDVALLKLKEKSLNELKEKMVNIPFLNLGDSEKLKDSEDLMVLGYPLASDSIQLSEGIFSGKEKDLFGFETLHTTAPINHGNSGGPTINSKGEVIGICVSKIEFAEGMGYLIPINEVKNVLEHLFEGQIIRYPFWGIVYPEKMNEATIKYLSNGKLDHGVYLQSIIKNSLAEKYGLKNGDILFELDNLEVDIHGEILVNGEKTSILTYVNKKKFGDSITFTVLRNDQELTLNCVKESGNEYNNLKKILPSLDEKIDYEIIDGIVIIPLSGNHIEVAGDIFYLVGTSFTEFIWKDYRPFLIMTHALPDSEATESSFLEQSRILSKVNGQRVDNLEDLRTVVKKSIEDNDEYLILENHVGGIIAIPVEKVVESYNDLSNLGVNFSSPIFE